MSELTLEKPGIRIETPPMTAELVLLNKAIDAGRSADEIGKLVELARSMQQDKARTEFNAAMNHCQAEMPLIVKDKAHTNAKAPIRYAALENVQRICKPVYTKHGFSLSFSTEDSPLAGHTRIVAVVRHLAGHSEKHQADIPLDNTGARGGAMNAPQASGSTLSYGQRYLTKLIFNLTVADEDNDAQGQCITPEQIGKINDLLEECRAAKKPVDFAAFLQWLGIESLDKLPQTRFELALYELKRKRGQRKEPMPC